MFLLPCLKRARDHGFCVKSHASIIFKDKSAFPMQRHSFGSSIRVTPWNVDELRNAVQVPRNNRMAIARKLPTSRVSAQTGKGPKSDFEGKVVNVHLRNADVLVNRQDRIISAVLLTKDTFLTRDEYNQLLYFCCVPSVAPSSENPSDLEVPESEMKNDASKTKSKTRQKGRRKIKRVIGVKYHKLKFELLIVFKEEPHILLAEVAQRTAKNMLVKNVKNIE